MNNKGQSLVAFALLLPVFFIIITVIWDLGNMSVQKSKYETDAKSIIKYGIKHIDEENIKQKLENLLNINVKENSKIEIENNKIIITITYKYENLYNKIIKNNEEITIKYIGYIENNKIKIEKEG